jgi:hypothetical protein
VANCNGHFPHYTRAAADVALRKLVVEHKQAGDKGKSYKRLVVWLCGDHFHVGHRRTLLKKQQQAKPPSPGEVRRKERHEQKAADRSAKRRARHGLVALGYFYDIETAARRAKYAVDDFADSMAQARKLAERYVFVK